MQEEKKLTGGSVTGEYIDTIIYSDGTKEVLEGRNLIVNDIGKLIACLFSRKSGYSGLTHWAIGSGLDSWDTSSVDPKVTDSRLTTEIFRKAIQPTDIKFLDSSGEPTETVTNVIAITVTFSTSEANGKWREFGIFGGNASASLNSGLMINHKIHKILTKDDSMTVERQIRFTFN